MNRPHRMDLLAKALRLPRKLANQAKLWAHDPEQAGRNLLQFTNRELFEARLVDVISPVPMHVVHDAVRGPGGAAAGAPRLNVLDQAWTRSGMTGGPNTVLNLALRVAQRGIPVRLVATVGRPAMDPAWLRGHLASLLGGGGAPEVEVAHAGDAAAPLPVGPGDVFLATHWSTAQQLKRVLPGMRVGKFFYMLQEFEPGFYAWSSNYARAIETYGMEFWPIVNERSLAEYLFAQPFGRLGEPRLREEAMVFEPAVDRAAFRLPDPGGAPRPRRLLFYARPTNDRNMFGLGLMALRAAAADPAFAGWEFQAIGGRGSVPEMALGGGHVLRPAPWVDYSGYANLLRAADLLLCPMLSPHTSYPVLEMAACGGLSVTNTFATKTAALFARLSPRVIAREPTVEDLAAGMVEGARRVNAGEPRSDELHVAGDWEAELGPVADRMVALMRGLPA